MSITFKSVFLLLTLSLTSCQSVYYSAWEKLGVEKRDILVDRVEDARDSQTEAQAEFASALAEFSALINFDDAQTAADDVSARISKVKSVADALFEEWQAELALYTNPNLKRDSQRKLHDTKAKYKEMLRAMRKVESSMPPVLNALQNNVLYLKHNLNANAVGALQGELSSIQSDVGSLIDEMNAAIKQSDRFIASMKG